MATQAHCAFVFETLSANLEHREPLSLFHVEDLWKHYKARVSGADEAVADTTEDQEPQDGDVLYSDTEDVAAGPTSTLSPAYRPAAVTRLMAHTPSTSSSSSVQSTLSTPSRTSEASSATSKSSSRSSLFSPPPTTATRSKAAATAEYPLFVTYNVLQKDGEKRLRGCIGTFEPQELENGLSAYALTS
jgi:hypothetical protein